MHRFKLLVIFIISLLAYSCDFINEFKNMAAPEVDSCSYTEECISIRFTSEMDKGRTENSFSCRCNDSEENGTFIWKSDTMNFYPAGGIKNKSDYEIEVGTGAEDTFGNSLSKAFIFKFSTKESSRKFSVKSININDGDLIDDLLKTIRIDFTDSVDTASFYNGFSISPSLSGEISFDAGNNSVEFRPNKKMSFDTKFTITLQDTIADKYGNFLDSSFKVSFHTAKEDEYWLESLSADGAVLASGGILNSGIEKDCTITLNFAGNVDEDAKKSPVSISPSHSYTCSWNSVFSQCTIKFDEEIDYETILEIVPAENLYGEKAKNHFQARYLLLFNGENSKPPAVNGIRYYENYASGSSVDISHGTNIAFTTTADACFEFELSVGASSNLYKSGIYGKIDIDVVIGDTTIDEKSLEVENIGNGKYMVRIFCNVTSGTIQTPVILTVDKSLEDSNGNQLGNDYIIRFNSI